MGELIYLYIGNVERNIKECGIQFSNQYKVFYDKEKKTINIEKKQEKNIIKYGKNIRNFKLLVGKNGCGKSTILDLLGTTRRDRYAEFPRYIKQVLSKAKPNKKYGWFAVYHLYNNIFAIEGYNSDMIVEIENLDKNYEEDLYNVVIKYDFNKKCILKSYSLQEHRKRGGRGNLRYLFYQMESDIKWFTQSKKNIADNKFYDDFLFERKYMDKVGFETISHYLYETRYNNKFFNDLQDNLGASISIILNDVYEKYNFEDEIYEKDLVKYNDLLKQAIYGESKQMLSMDLLDIQDIFVIDSGYSDKQYWVIQYLESILWIILRKKISKARKTYGPEKRGCNDYEYRKNFLLDFLRQLVKEDKFILDTTIRITENDYKIIKEICEGIEKIRAWCFMDANRIHMEIKRVDSYFIKKFMRAMDLNEEFINRDKCVIEQKNLIDVNFRNMSSGEAFYLDFYASLYWGINQMKNHSPGDTCILLLDEPDRCFHPEWSRRFVKNLTETLTSEPFNKFNYQIIIATHSPLLLSDVLKEDIICLNTTEDGNIRVEKAPYGFMSNINDILLDSFFMEAPYGAWAKEYVNKLIKQINEISLDIKNEQDIEKIKAEIEQLEKKVEVIGEELIRDSLLKKLKRLKYKIIEKNTLRKNREEEIKYLEERLKMLREND